MGNNLNTTLPYNKTNNADFDIKNEPESEQEQINNICKNKEC